MSLYPQIPLCVSAAIKLLFSNTKFGAVVELPRNSALHEFYLEFKTAKQLDKNDIGSIKAKATELLSSVVFQYERLPIDKAYQLIINEDESLKRDLLDLYLTRGYSAFERKEHILYLKQTLFDKDDIYTSESNHSLLKEKIEMIGFALKELLANFHALDLERSNHANTSLIADTQERVAAIRELLNQQKMNEENSKRLRSLRTILLTYFLLEVATLIPSVTKDSDEALKLTQICNKFPITSYNRFKNGKIKTITNLIDAVKHIRDAIAHTNEISISRVGDPNIDAVLFNNISYIGNDYIINFGSANIALFGQILILMKEMLLAFSDFYLDKITILDKSTLKPLFWDFCRNNDSRYLGVKNGDPKPLSQDPNNALNNAVLWRMNNLESNLVYNQVNQMNQLIISC